MIEFQTLFVSTGTTSLVMHMTVNPAVHSAQNEACQLLDSTLLRCRARKKRRLVWRYQLMMDYTVKNSLHCARIRVLSVRGWIKNAPKWSTITYCRGVPEVPMHKLGN